MIGQPYSVQFLATGGTGPYTWSLQTGTLPAGLTLSPTGLLSGAPTAAGPSTFRVRVADSASQVTTGQFDVTIAPAALVITTASPLISGTAGVAYGQTFAATGGTPGFIWSVLSGALPTGLSLSSGGVISGTPTIPGTSTLTIQVKDSGSAAQTASKVFTLQIAPAPLVITTTSPLPQATLNTAYSQTFAAVGGVGPYSWSVVSGTLPPNVSLTSNGILSGTPTAAGAFTFVVRVRDSQSPTAAQTDKSFTLVVDAGFPVITTTVLPQGQALIMYTTALTAGGGIPPYIFSLQGGSLPPGFTLSPSGQITGTAGDVTSASFVA